MKRIYLIRHADARPLGAPDIVNDEERLLSDKGEAQAVALGTAFRRLDIPINAVVTSPLLRARRTAEIFLSSRQLPSEILQENDCIAPGRSSKKLAKFIRQMEAENIALVGHEPDMSEHAAWLIGSKKARFDFAKAAVACICCEEEPAKGAGVLNWFITPDWFTMSDQRSAISNQPNRQ